MLSKLTLQFGSIAIPVRREQLIGDGTQPHGNWVCKDGHRPITVTGGTEGTPGEPGDPGVESCGVKHDGDCSRVVGFPTGNGWFVPDKDTVDSLEGVKDGTVSFYNRVPAADVDPAYFDATFVIHPDDKADVKLRRAFWVFAEALRKQNRVMIGTATLSRDEKMVVLRWSKQFGCLLLCTGAFDEQIRREKIAAATASIASLAKPTKEELAFAALILDATPEEPFDPSKVQPTRWHALNKLIADHGGGAAASSVRLTPKVEPPANDLLSALKASVAASKPKTAPPRKRPVKAKA